MSCEKVLIGGQWIASRGSESFTAMNPATQELLNVRYPVSPWAEVEAAISHAATAARAVRGWPGERFAHFLECFADGIEGRTDALVEAAHQETALPVSPRLKDGELPRTTNQLRQAAAAARTGSWSMPTIDSATGIRSMLGQIGPVVVFGPNNFPFAFNSIAGGDFAAAIAAGNPVIAKGHSSHPTTTRLFAEAADEAANESKMPPGFVQLIYRTAHADGAKLVAHPRIGATGYTGSRRAGLVLKEAADRAGKPIYLELSSVNPVFMLPGALDERLDAIVDDFSSSCLMGVGQFCTNPGLVVLQAGAASNRFIELVAARFQAAPVGTLLGAAVGTSLAAGVEAITRAGATIVAGGKPGGGTGCSFNNTLLTVSGSAFVTHPEELQTEAFGNASLVVIAENEDQLCEIAECLEGNLTGSIYSHSGSVDDGLYARIEPALRQRVGRLLNDKMPTGVAVSAAMNHGGPFPATGHPGFTAVGVPASIRRFAMLQCYDNVRPGRLPHALADRNSNPDQWRCVDGQWTRDDVSVAAAK